MSATEPQIDQELAQALRDAFEQRGFQDSGEGVSAASPPPPVPHPTTDDGEGEQDNIDITQLPGYDPSGQVIEPPVAGQGEGEGEGQGEGEQPPPSQLDLNAIAREFYGDRPITQEQAIALFQIANDLSTLTDEQREQIGRVLYPQSYPQPQPQGQAQPPVQPQPQPQPVGSPAGFDYSPDPLLAEIEEDYPEIAKAIRAQQQLTQRQIAELTNWRDEYQREQFQRQQAEYNRGAKAGMDAWRAQHPEFTEEELVAISVRTGAGAYAGALVERGHTPEQAVQLALDAAVLTDPTYKQKVIDAEVARREAELTKNLSKKQKAAALTGSGGPASHELPQVNLRDVDARRNAMRQAIQSARTEDITSPPA